MLSYILPFIAIKKNMILKMESIIKKLIPNNNFLFDNKRITNKKKIFFLKEILREKVLKIYDKEIPYNICLKIDKLKKKNGNVFIDIIIYVNNILQKKIIIGKDGIKIKKLIDMSNKSIEKYLKMNF